MTATMTTDLVQSGRWARSAVRPTPDHETIDRALLELAEPRRAPDGFWARLRLVLRGVRSRPSGASLITTWVFAVLTVAGTVLIQPTRTVATSVGTAEVDCGLDVFLYGHSDPAIASACRQAGSLSLALFIPAALLMLAGLAGLIALTLTLRQGRDGEMPSLLDRLRDVPVSVAPLLVGVLAAIVATFALRPATIAFIHDGQLVSASCGPETLLRRFPDPDVASRCADAYQGRGVVVILCLVIIALVGANLLRQIVRSQTTSPKTKSRTWGVVGGAVFGMIALVALAPVPVVLGDPDLPTTARCGLDVFLGGYPDPTVQAACRSAYASHAGIGLTSGLVAAALLTLGFLLPTRRDEDDDAVVPHADKETVT